MSSNGKVTAIIVAAGSSTRLGFDKIFADLLGRPILRYSLEAFESADCVAEVVVAANAENFERVEQLSQNFSKVKAVVQGGATRAESVMLAIKAVKSEFIAIHDGARPFITPRLIESVVAEARRFKAAIPVIAVTDTIKVVDDGFIVSTPDRRRLFAAQTPQVFELVLYLKAAKLVGLDNSDITDDSMIVEKLSIKVKVIAGDSSNIKITTKEDLLLAENLIERRKSNGTC